MKFITKKGAPDIPLEILEARDDDRLVIFCGSGISYQAGLKDFRGLVDQVYTSLPDTKKAPEQEAYKQEQYDRVLELLEHRYFSKTRADNFLVRKKIIENLTIKYGADLSTHKAILDLAKTRNGKVRLVTTNVDLGFQMADPTIETWTDTAPKLPVPKPYKWNSLVHLHGVINNTLDPNGENFVFTSGDFGTAYLTERWASRFVGELFRNFIVLFIGYSINDPVIRYMTDAIAAERRKGDLHFRKPFILASTQTNTRSKDLEVWRTKGVEPILYNAGSAHLYLHETLKKWAAYCSDGMRAKERIISINSRIPPLPPFEDDQTKQVVDTLQERVDKNGGSLSGIPAKIFAGLDPVPSIAWLPALEKYGLLDIFSLPTKPQPVSYNPISGNLAHPSKPSNWLWQWLVNHLESTALIHWVISNGGCLHPVLADFVQDRLTGTTPPTEPYFTFWKFTVNKKVPCSRYDSFVMWKLLASFKDTVSRIDLETFLHSLSPKVKFSKSIRFYAELEESLGQKPYSAEIIVQAGEEHLFEEVTKLNNYPNLFIPILLDISMHLKKAMEMSEILGLADSKKDKSHWDMPSILPHEQNKRYNSWVILIELCRDVWQAAWEKDQNLAKLILETWKTIRYPIFKRLVLHAYSIEGVVDPKIAFNYLLDEEGWWLWTVETEREKYRLLNKIWPRLSKDDVKKLIDTIVIGPPREMYREDMVDEEWKYVHARSVWKILSKLETFGRDLNRKGREVLKQVSAAHIEWRLRGGDRDELSHWMEAGIWGEKSDITVADLVEREFEEIRMLLSETTSEYYDGRFDDFRSFCKEEHEKTYDFLDWLFRQGDWTCAIWHAVLGSLNDDKQRQFKKIAHLLTTAPQYFYEKEAWAIASWIKSVIETIESDSTDEANFQTIFKKVLEYAPQSEFTNDGDVVTAAINDPIGMMAESLITRIGCRKINRGDGIPHGQLANCLRLLVDGRGDSFVLGRVILASRLHYFHAIDPDWAKRNIISKMIWQASDEAQHLWEGYLWMPRITADLLIDFKDDYLLAIKNVNLLHSGKEHLFQLTTIIFLQFPDSFTRNEKTEILRNIGTEGRAVVSDFLLQSYKDNGSKDDDNVTFWKHRLEPLLKLFWPKDAESISSATSRNLALLAIYSSKTFPDAVETVTPLIGPTMDMYTIVRNLKKSELPSQYPTDVLKLLGLVFTESGPYQSGDFRELLIMLLSADESLSRNAVYQQIDRFLQERNI